MNEFDESACLPVRSVLVPLDTIRISSRFGFAGITEQHTHIILTSESH